jgi:hypothetical protein
MLLFLVKCRFIVSNVSTLRKPEWFKRTQEKERVQSNAKMEIGQMINKARKLDGAAVGIVMREAWWGEGYEWGEVRK